ncbi:hypothetical protein [Roseisolibacter sp. H3M3-2]|uniref:hypothetical protein n=1 Tax=Roseisolibacter sp. H3M3-2 TaxID=3031323 RepID=UPI0023DCC13D|nr:hypothetical protein [Roseisolibacter sp. H3M3-2]MDF1502851.1 hypothetical protein [Roseisolibacter sp. H3M3-2]
MMRRLVLAACLLALAAPAAAQEKKPKKAKKQDGQGQQAGPPKPYAPSALFASDSVLHFTLVTDFRALAGQRDTLRPKGYAGTVRVGGGDGEKAVPVQVYTRGHFRLRPDRCSFPPLRVVFDKGTRGTPFDDQKALKLVTHCRDGSEEHEEYVLREYLAYRAHQVVTPASFRTRLARVRYVRQGDTTKVVERWGFLIESEREMARRLGGRVLEAKGALFENVTPDSAASVAMWEYFLGNSDWSLSALHNVRLVQRGPEDIVAVPYDFDFSGFVDTRYATPDPSLPIKTVQERLWRGPCLSPAAAAAAAAPYVARREALERVPVSLPIDGGWGERAQRFMRRFFDDVKDPARFAEQTRRGKCPVSN